MKDQEALIARIFGMLKETPAGRVRDHGSNPAYQGVLENADAHAKMTGPCGDTNEMFLCIRHGRIEDIRFVTDGCLFTVAACDATARLAMGKTPEECLFMDRQMILDYLEYMPEDHEHCALLAVMTLYEAVKAYGLSGKS